jgi:hypothetical protein
MLYAKQGKKDDLAIKYITKAIAMLEKQGPVQDSCVCF